MSDTDDMKRRARELCERLKPWTVDLDMFDGDEGIVAVVYDQYNDVMFTATTDLFIEPADPWTEADSARRDEQWRKARSSPEFQAAKDIAESRTLLPALLARIEALEKERDELEAAQSAMERIDRVCETIDGRLDKHEIATLRTRIEALEAERDEAKANQAGEHVLKMRADLADLRARLAKYERVVALAHEWNRLDAHRLGHTGDANCCAGDHDTCEAIPARDELSAALDALDPKEATDGYWG